MKKIVIGVVVILLLIAVGGGITYAVLGNKKDEEVVDKKPDEEKISNKELEEYLSYIPNNVYEEVTNINDIDKNILIGKLLTDASSCWEDKNCSFDMEKKLKVKDYYPKKYQKEYKGNYIPLDYIKNKMLEDYNIELDDIKNGTEFNDSHSYVFNKEYFLPIGFSPIITFNYINDYEIEEDELIIYNYYTYYGGEEELCDFQGKCIDKVDYTKVDGDYLKENKNKFTLYKHTFKKADDKYYWFSTELAEK